MGDGEHHVLLGLEELPVLPVGCLQLLLVAVFSIYVPVYDGIEHDCQQGNTQCKTGHGTVGRVTVKYECLIFRCEPCICFLLEFGNEHVHFPVQFPYRLSIWTDRYAFRLSCSSMTRSFKVSSIRLAVTTGEEAVCCSCFRSICSFCCR